MQLLELLQQFQGVVVVRTRTRLLVQARHRFQVVVHHIWRAGIQDAQSTVKTCTEVRHQHFNGRSGRVLAHLADTFHKVGSATITQVVTIYGGNHHVGQLHGTNGLGQVGGLVLVQRIGTTVAHVTEWATTCALVAHDHEGCRALAKAFPNIGTGGFFTHREQLVLAQRFLDLVETGVRCSRLHPNPIRFFQTLCLHDLNGNARGLGLGLLLLRCVVFDNARAHSRFGIDGRICRGGHRRLNRKTACGQHH